MPSIKITLPGAAFNAVRETTAREELKYGLNGVLWYKRQIVASDTKRLIAYTVPIDGATEQPEQPEKQVVIDFSGVKCRDRQRVTIEATFPDREQDDEGRMIAQLVKGARVTVETVDRNGDPKTGAAVYDCERMDGVFPAWEQFIEPEHVEDDETAGVGRGERAWTADPNLLASLADSVARCITGDKPAASCHFTGTSSPVTIRGNGVLGLLMPIVK